MSGSPRRPIQWVRASHGEDRFMPTPAGITTHPFDAPWIGSGRRPAGGGAGAARERIAGRRSRWALAGAGGVPVTLIAGSAFGLDLSVLAVLVLVPVLAGLLARMAAHRTTRRLLVQ